MTRNLSILRPSQGFNATKCVGDFYRQARIIVAIAGFVLFGVCFENHVAVGIILTQPAISLGVGNGSQIIIGIVFERNDTAGGWSSGGDWWWKGRLKVFFRRPLMSI